MLNWFTKQIKCGHPKNSKKDKNYIRKKSRKAIIQTINIILSNIHENLPDEQYFISPMSIDIALSMIYEGANKKTCEKNEHSMAYFLSKGLKLEQDKSKRLEIINSTISIFKENKKFLLTMANGIFVNSN